MRKKPLQCPPPQCHAPDLSDRLVAADVLSRQEPDEDEDDEEEEDDKEDDDDGDTTDDGYSE